MSTFWILFMCSQCLCKLSYLYTAAGLNLTLSPHYRALLRSVSTILSVQAVSYQSVSVPNWEKTSQTLPELFRSNKELQTSVSHSTTVTGPPVLQHAILFLLCMSDVPPLGPEEFLSAHFLGGVGGMRNTFFFFLPHVSSQQRKCQPSQNPKQQMYRVTDLSHGSTSLRGVFLSLSSGSESPGSSPRPILDRGYAKYVSECCAYNMWQEIF